MKVVGFAGYSGAGKTTLLEQLVAMLKARGERVSVVKHAHHDFDVDHPGKDSWRHRQAGAYEVILASDRRVAKMRELETRSVPTLESLLDELDACDWVLVEGFKHARIAKLEIWREAAMKPVLYPDDARVVAICTDDASTLPCPTTLPVLDLDDAEAVLAYLTGNASVFERDESATKGDGKPAAG